jgi:hypothetical protein
MTMQTTERSDQLKQLARDIHAGHVFTDRHVRPNDANLLSSIFLPLMFVNEEQLSALKADPPALIYEYFSEAGERGINGYPMFMSMKTISTSDWSELQAYLTALKEAPDPLASVPVPEVGREEDD